MTSVTIPNNPSTMKQMAPMVRFIWHVNSIEAGLIATPTALSEGVEDYPEVRIDTDDVAGTARFTAKSERACRALTEAGRTWRG